jgi:hypothetical protein
MYTSNSAIALMVNAINFWVNIFKVNQSFKFESTEFGQKIINILLYNFQINIKYELTRAV